MFSQKKYDSDKNPQKLQNTRLIYSLNKVKKRSPHTHRKLGPHTIKTEPKERKIDCEEKQKSKNMKLNQTHWYIKLKYGCVEWY